MEKYDLLTRVGQGSYGVVMRARLRQTGKIVAIKKINLQTRDKINICRELCSLRNLYHNNIVHLIDVFSSSDTLSLVTDFIPYHLNDVILDPRRPKNDAFTRLFYRQILAAIEYMHSVGVMHRDLKPENILVTAMNIVKIADFGQARLYHPDEPDTEYEENVATRWYRAPELLLASRKYTPSVDIWAIGCILAEFNNRTPLFNGRSDMEQISRIFQILGTPSDNNWPSWSDLPDANKLLFIEIKARKDWNNIVKDASSDYLDFLHCHIQLDSDHRWTASRLLNHTFMKSSDSDGLRYRPSRRRRPTEPLTRLLHRTRL